MTEPGELVDSGAFRVDRGKALEKLSAFQLQDLHQAVLALIRCAVASGASRVDIEAGPDNMSRIRFDGRPLTPAELADPFAALFEEEGAGDARSRQLAVGLLGAIGWCGGKLGLEGGAGDQRRYLRLPSPAEFTATPSTKQFTETVIGLGRPGLIDIARLREDCAVCPIPIHHLAVDVPRTRRPEFPPGLYFEEAGRYGWLSAARDPEAGSSLKLCALGVAVGESKLPDSRIPVEGYVNDDSFALNASQNAVVHDERFAAMNQAVARASERLVPLVAAELGRSLPVTARLVDSVAWAAAWRHALVGSSRRASFEEGFMGRAWLALNAWLGGDRHKIERSLRQAGWDAEAARWVRHIAAIPSETLEAPGLRLTPVFLTTRGGAVSLEGLDAWIKRDGRVIGWGGMRRAGAPEAVWCSTPVERADLMKFGGLGLVDIR